MGLSYDRLAAVKPEIILTAISCFGDEGPYRNRTGFDFIAQAMSGAMNCGGFPDKPPIRAFFNPMDYGTALAAAVGTLLALRHRDKTGEGQKVDLALLKTAISFTAPMIAEKEVLGRSRPMIANRAPYLTTTDLFECRDGYVFIASIMNSIWRRLARLIGHEELLKDPELHNDLSRYEHRDKIDPLVADWIRRAYGRSGAHRNGSRPYPLQPLLRSGPVLDRIPMFRQPACCPWLIWKCPVDGSPSAPTQSKL